MTDATYPAGTERTPLALWWVTPHDECHGRVSSILLDGEVVETYHDAATYEFPYFMGCFRDATA